MACLAFRNYRIVIWIRALSNNPVVRPIRTLSEEFATMASGDARFASSRVTTSKWGAAGLCSCNGRWINRIAQLKTGAYMKHAFVVFSIVKFFFRGVVTRLDKAIDQMVLKRREIVAAIVVVILYDFDTFADDWLNPGFLELLLLLLLPLLGVRWITGSRELEGTGR